MHTVLFEAILFGIVTILLGLLFSIVFSQLKVNLPKECEEWDKNYMMEVILFAIGFSLRFLLTNDTIKKYLYSS